MPPWRLCPLERGLKSAIRNQRSEVSDLPAALPHQVSTMSQPMPPTFVPAAQRPAWQALARLAAQAQPHLRERLQQPGRAEAFRAEGAGLTLDFSRQCVDEATVDALLALADDSGVMAQAQAMFRGDPINATEGRAVLHVALRGSEQPDPPWGEALAAEVRTELDRVCHAAEALRSGAWRGHSGERITDVVNLGIGGSDLGPRMVCEALVPLSAQPPLRVHFVSNPDAWSLHTVLAGLDPARTAFVVQSKTFTTQETLTLAASARDWVLASGCTAAQLPAHFLAVTARPERAQALGFTPERTLRIWDWVGGRYSVWSAIGLPVAIAVGEAMFRELLAGARAMDVHFLAAPPRRNLPLLMALLGVWNRNFLAAPTQLIVPYASLLSRFVPFVQQMDMESNGKSTQVDGQPVTAGTGPIVWGGLGIDGQHAYFQLVHQGSHRIPVDFIGERRSTAPLPGAAEHHRVVLLNLNAQAQALALGRDAKATAVELRAAGLPEDEVQRLLPHRTFRGDVPSSTVWVDTLTPQALGALIALYEHKVFCQAALWGIHAFDQWGVELGKSMAQAMERQHV